MSKLPVSQLAANRVEPRKTSFLQNVLLLFQLEFQRVIIDIKLVFCYTTVAIGFGQIK